MVIIIRDIFVFASIALVKRNQQSPEDQQEFPTKEEMLALLQDHRSYQPPPYFVVNPFNEKEIWRTNYLGYIEYLNPKATSQFFSSTNNKEFKTKPKFNLRERKKNLILRQNQMVKDLDEVFAFPFSIHFYATFSKLLMGEMLESPGFYTEKSNMIVQSKWYFTCMTALMLKRFFGGNIINKRYINLTVELEAVNYNVPFIIKYTALIVTVTIFLNGFILYSTVFGEVQMKAERSRNHIMTNI